MENQPPTHPRVLVIGDGPTGLSCALLLAKGGVEVDVVGPDGTPTHKAVLHNYLGTPGILGPDFMRLSREQVAALGARLHKAAVERLQSKEGGFTASTKDGAELAADYVVLTNGRDTQLADALGLEKGPHGVRVDLNGRTSVPRAYAGGWLTRGHKIQAAISVGDGAAIALDILSEVKGKPFHDFDLIPKPIDATA